MAVQTQRTGTPHVVIVGGGFGGLYAAKALHGARVRVTLLDRRNHHLFQPLLYQVATAGLSPGDIAAPIRGILRRQENVRVLLGEVSSVDLERRTVHYEGGETSYDYLVLSLGARHDYFGHDDWARFAPGLKSLEDALEIRRRILTAFEAAERTETEEERRALLTFAIVGGGPTGVELAGAVAEIALRTLRHDFRAIDPGTSHILLVEGGSRILPGFPEDLSQRATDALVRLGVDVRTGSLVSEITSLGLTLPQGFIPARTVLWAAGVQTSSLAHSLGAEVDRAGRVRVTADLSLPGHPEVFVIGDMAHVDGPGKDMLPGVAPVAMQEGRHVAQTIRREVGGAARNQFRYRERGNLATIGRSAAVADIRGVRLHGPIAWLAWLLIHILFLIGFDNRIVVLWRWVWAYFTYQRAARLITGSVDAGPPGGPGVSA